MYEKYNSYEVGVGGGGGEYIPQIGFGWTNGVALLLLDRLYSAGVVSDDGGDDGTSSGGDHGSGGSSAGSNPFSEQDEIYFGIGIAAFLLIIAAALFLFKKMSRGKSDFFSSSSSTDYATRRSSTIGGEMSKFPPSAPVQRPQQQYPTLQEVPTPNPLVDGVNINA